MEHKGSHVGTFYDTVWTQYIPEFESSKEHLELFFDDEEIVSKRILDAGCGTGIFCTIFGSKGAQKVVGIDISRGSLRTAEGLREGFKLDNVELQLTDMLRLPFRNEIFDIVWAWGTVHHTEDPKRAIEELMRVLKNHGTLFLAIYKRTSMTPVHEIIRKTLIRFPRKFWIPISRIMACFLKPFVKVFKKREKARKGETLEELILDWYFVPIRFYYTPDEISEFLEERDFTIEKFLPGSGRFESTSNFIFKSKKRGKSS